MAVVGRHRARYGCLVMWECVRHRQRLVRLVGPVSVMLGAMAWSGAAAAGNGLHPRTPVIWDDAACVTTVDRSVDPSLSLTYTIPFEDTEVGEDEVEDSRTHQFLAFCRDKDPQTVLPNWVAWADVEAAGMLPLDVEPDDVTDAQVLDLSPEWEGCWARVTDDADRRPITETMASQPVVWDTTGLTPGAWTVYGYTYEPAFNVYVRRPGIVYIVDDPAPEATAPGVALTTGEQILYRGGETTFEGCIAAMPGSTIDAYWSIAAETADWVPFLEGEPVSGETVSIPFVAPEALTGKTAMIRVDITDPMGRQYTTYMAELVMVLMQDNPSDCDPDGGAFVADPGCDPDGGTGSDDDGTTSGGVTTGDDGQSSDGDGTTVPASGDGDDGSSSRCSVDPDGAPGMAIGFGLLALGLAGTRRRDR